MHVIGAGLGRTGTHSLKLALNQLGLGPCHHMEAVRKNIPGQVPLWSAALDGRPDWQAIYEGFHSAVDWPTACFFRELQEAFPSARYVLTDRSPESWAGSFAATIQKLVAERDQAPPEMQPWLNLVNDLLIRTGLPMSLDLDGLKQAFVAHNEAVREQIPAHRLLVYDVKAGWGPLCEFLQAPVPEASFPQSNRREEFWVRVLGAT